MNQFIIEQIRSALSRKFDVDIVVLYLLAYGSRVYGTNNEASDYDFYIVFEEKGTVTKNLSEYNDQVFLNYEGNEINLHVMHIDAYTESVNQAAVGVIETLFVPNLLAHETEQFEHSKIGNSVLKDIVKLRQSFSQKSSNSFVKAKKKFADAFELNDPSIHRIGLKSLYHSLRIALFAETLMVRHCLTKQDFESLEHVQYWNDIKQTLFEDGPGAAEALIEKYKPVYKQLHSKMKASSNEHWLVYKKQH